MTIHFYFIIIKQLVIVFCFAFVVGRIAERRGSVVGRGCQVGSVGLLGWILVGYLCYSLVGIFGLELFVFIYYFLTYISIIILNNIVYHYY